jgi:hypothetical protein
MESLRLSPSGANGPHSTPRPHLHQRAESGIVTSTRALVPASSSSCAGIRERIGYQKVTGERTRSWRRRRSPLTPRKTSEANFTPTHRAAKRYRSSSSASASLPWWSPLGHRGARVDVGDRCAAADHRTEWQHQSNDSAAPLFRRAATRSEPPAELQCVTLRPNVPRTLRNTQRHSSGLVPGQVYGATGPSPAMNKRYVACRADRRAA